MQISAIAAGDAAVLKPSEQTPAFSALFAELVPKYLDPELYHVINGGVPETTKVSIMTPRRMTELLLKRSAGRFSNCNGTTVSDLSATRMMM